MPESSVDVSSSGEVPEAEISPGIPPSIAEKIVNVLNDDFIATLRIGTCHKIITLLQRDRHISREFNLVTTETKWQIANTVVDFLFCFGNLTNPPWEDLRDSLERISPQLAPQMVRCVRE